MFTAPRSQSPVKVRVAPLVRLTRANPAYNQGRRAGDHHGTVTATQPQRAHSDTRSTFSCNQAMHRSMSSSCRRAACPPLHAHHHIPSLAAARPPIAPRRLLTIATPTRRGYTYLLWPAVLPYSCEQA